MLPSANVTPLLAPAPAPSLPTITTSNHDLPDTIQALPFTGMNVPAKLKRSRSVAFPVASLEDSDGERKRSKTNAPVGMSKQAGWKRRTLDKIAKGTWVRNAKKWADYKSKLLELDEHFEVLDNPRFPRNVKHSRCGSWFVMTVPYNVDRFKAHVDKCSYSTAPGGMKTLDSYGVCVRPLNAPSPSPSIPSKSPSPSDTNLPCLGITEKDDARIPQYIKRTPMHSAGGDNIFDIAKELFADDYKNLSSKKKDIVRQKQIQTRLWSNDHIRKSIHAIGENACDGNALLAKDGSLMPCNQCLALLNLRAFRNAISQKGCENENRGFIPHVYQSPDVGRIFSLGLYELLDGVRTISIFTQHPTHS